ncbi:DNA-binding protein [Devosia sp. 2618]|uniref:DNA-binding protein n=1 Tax=Devosia sp. 2618 TaxID=3156454 RepID=UPI00339B6C68
MTEPLTLDLLWGAENIAAYIGRTERQTKDALAKGHLPGRKCNGRWVASRAELQRFFGQVAA